MSDWYLNTDWNDDIEAAFFARLKRSRSQRDQYLVLQALHLVDTHPEVTLRLIAQYFETRTGTFHDDRARRAASMAHIRLGEYKTALDDYLAILERQGDSTSLYVASSVDFAFLAARHRSEEHYGPALDHLGALSPRPGYEAADGFCHAAARALILKETGRDPATALREAKRALAAPGAVQEQYPDVVWRLMAITRG